MLKPLCCVLYRLVDSCIPIGGFLHGTQRALAAPLLVRAIVASGHADLRIRRSDGLHDVAWINVFPLGPSSKIRRTIGCIRPPAIEHRAVYGLVDAGGGGLRPL